MTRSHDLQIRRRLLHWFRRENRRLPWRGIRDPYRIWVSEVMLQQTTVAAVIPRYAAFLRRFPDLRTLARAREESVLAAWSGLGYYARARNLRNAARQIVRRHGGLVPNDPRELSRLPGFGEYMSAAVASLAYGRRLPAADANVTRVVSRLFAIGGTVGSRNHRRAVHEAVARILPFRRPGDLTAALMDLGQGTCTARDPACDRCPLAALCEARRKGRPERYPGKRPKKPYARVAIAAAIVERRGRALLVRRRGTFLDGMWDFPCAEADDGDRRAAGARLARRLAGLGLRRSGEPIATVRHTVVHRRMEIDVFRALGPVPRGRVAALPGRWFTPGQLSRAAIPTLTRKVARSAGIL